MTRRTKKRSALQVEIDRRSEALMASVFGDRRHPPELLLYFAETYARQGNVRLAYIVLKHAYETYAFTRPPVPLHPAAPGPKPTPPGSPRT